MHVVDGVYRSAEERRNWLQYAPIDRLRATLLELQHTNETALDRLSVSVAAQAEESADRAEMAPHPIPISARRQVWREPVHESLQAIAATVATYVLITMCTQSLRFDDSRWNLHATNGAIRTMYHAGRDKPGLRREPAFLHCQMQQTLLAHRSALATGALY